jgi:hypothetical protein
MPIRPIISAAAIFVVAAAASAQVPPMPERTLHEGVTTRRPVPGAAYELAGKRVVFANWYYIQPGDLDWRDDSGKSVYVDGNEGPYAAHHVAINAPRGVRIAAEKPRVVGPFERPHRMIIQEGKLYKGWTDSDYYESKGAVHWEKKAALKFDAGVFERRPLRDNTPSS